MPSLVYAQECGEPRCVVSNQTITTPEFRSDIGYCTHPPVGGKCPFPYVYSGFFGTCIGYPVCDGSCFWDTNSKKCVSITSVVGPGQGGGGGMDPSWGDNATVNGTFCVKEVNNETFFASCVKGSYDNGSSVDVCPLDMVDCNQNVSPGICPEGTQLNNATGLCEALPQINCKDGGTYLPDLKVCSLSAFCPHNGMLDPNLDKCIYQLGQENCPSGFTFDPVQQACLADVTCPPPGIFNPATDRCETSVIQSCPSGFTYDSTSGRCQANPTCPSGFSYDPISNKCVTNASVSCPSGFTYNPSTGKCETNPSCPSPGFYNPSTKRCEASVVLNCPSGSNYNSSTGKCEASPSCPSGWSYSPSANVCVRSATLSCPSGTSYNSSTGKCEANPTCPSGGSYNPSTNRCEAGAIQTCPPGTTYNSSTGKCEASPSISCPSPGTYNPSTGRCETSGTLTGSCQVFRYRGYSHIHVELYFDSDRNSACAIVHKNTMQCRTRMGWCVPFPDGNECGIIPARERIGICVYFVDGGSRFCVRDYFGGTLGCGSITRQCPSGYTPFGTPSSGGCEASPQITCPSNTTYNPSTGKCEALPQFSCPSGYTLSGSICIANAQCPSGTSLNTVTDKCESSPVYQCPSGSTYDSTLRMCVMSASCRSGLSLNPSTDKCEAVPSQSCPSGYSLSGSVCIANPVCSTGTFNSVTGKCEVNPTFNCPSGSSYDPSIGKCATNALCPTGSSLNPTSDKCEVVPTPTCASGYTLSGNVCHTSPVCPSGSSFNGVIDKCVIPASNLCPGSYVYDASIKLCVMNPVCLSSYYVYSPTIDACVAQPDYGCPIGSYFNPQSGKCEAYVECPQGSQYDPSLDGCTDGTWACPWGPHRPCVNYEGRKVCSPYDCGGMEDEEDGPPEGLEDDGERTEDACLGTIYIFNGKKMRCRKSGVQTGFHNCCDEAKGRLYDSTGSTGMMLGDAIKAIYAAMTAVRLMYSLSQATGISVFGTHAEILSGGQTLTSFVSGTPEYKALVDTARSLGFEGYGYISISPNDNIVSTFGASYVQHYGPTIAYTIVNLFLSRAINDPVISSAVNVVGQIILWQMGVAGFGPIGVGLAVLNLVHALFTARCDQQDVLTSTLRESGYCHFIGERCIKKVLGSCVQRAKVFCCFNSKLARIIHEQGRPQLTTFGPDGGWGSARRPNCRGFTPEEFQALDFGRIDFSEYVEDIQRNLRQNVEPQLRQKFQETIDLMM